MSSWEVIQESPFRRCQQSSNFCSSTLSSSCYIVSHDWTNSNESKRMWKEAVVMASEGVTQFSYTKKKSTTKFRDPLKGNHNNVLPHPFHSNSLLSIPSFNTINISQIRETRQQQSGENYIMRSFMICTPHQILFR